MKAHLWCVDSYSNKDIQHSNIHFHESAVSEMHMEMALFRSYLASTVKIDISANLGKKTVTKITLSHQKSIFSFERPNKGFEDKYFVKWNDQTSVAPAGSYCPNVIRLDFIFVPKNECLTFFRARRYHYLLLTSSLPKFSVSGLKI